MKSLLVLSFISILLYSSSAHAWLWLRLLSAGSNTSKAVKTVKKASNITGKASTAAVVLNTVGTTNSSASSNISSNATKDILLTVGLRETPNYPIASEIIAAKKSGKNIYRIKVCKDSSGITQPIPHALGKCPFGSNPKLYNGPTLDLSRL